MAEDLFYKNIRYLFKNECDIIFKEEYDIVAINGDFILVIEVKNKLQKRRVDNFLEKKLPKFREIFTEFQGRRLFWRDWGLGGEK